jgi:hypothetical protein
VARRMRKHRKHGGKPPSLADLAQVAFNEVQAEREAFEKQTSTPITAVGNLGSQVKSIAIYGRNAGKTLELARQIAGNIQKIDTPKQSVDLESKRKIRLE